MKMLLKCALMVSAIVLSGSVVAEDGSDQTPLVRYFLQPNTSGDGGERFAEMLERHPTAAGEEEREDTEPKQYRSPEQPYLQDDYQQ